MGKKRKRSDDEKEEKVTVIFLLLSALYLTHFSLSYPTSRTKAVSSVAFST
jgi:hypothetical protein